MSNVKEIVNGIERGELNDANFIHEHGTLLKESAGKGEQMINYSFVNIFSWFYLTLNRIGASIKVIM